MIVIGRQTSMEFRGTQKRFRDVGQELKVDYLLTGTIQWDGRIGNASKVRVSPELVRVEDEASRWQQSYDRPFGDVFALQSEIAKQAGLALSGALDLGGRVEISTTRATNPEVYTLYLKGRAAAFELTREGDTRAQTYLQRAVRLDPAYAPAWAMLAHAQNDLGAYTGDFAPARASAEKAVSLDSTSAEALTALARVERSYWEFTRAEEHFKQAMARDPNHGLAYGFAGQLLSFRGRYDEARPLLQRAAELEPLFWGDGPFYPLLGQGQYQEAIRLARSRLAADSADNGNLYWEYLGRALLETGQVDEALRAFEKERAAKSRSALVYAWAWARAGRADSARKFLQAFGNRPMNGYDQAGVARLYANLGQMDSAFAWLDRLYTRRSSQLIWLNWDRAWLPLRSDPRFNDLIKRIGLIE
ncbi:MAG: tetratricopeptide repeat protein [Gemmatimonadetes bacterium]|nr:tetratricopeptide repeat protein [Gemmatimonadota bacterium]